MSGTTLDLLLALPVLGAFIVLFAPRQWATGIRRFAVLVTLAELALATALLDGDYASGRFAATSSHGYVWSLGIGLRLGADGTSAALVLLTALITPIALATSWSSVTTKVKEHAVCFLLLEAGLVGAFLATDLFVFYVCWELVLVPLYLLIGIWGSGERAVSSTKFFLYTLAGSFVMLIAILYVGSTYAGLARHPSFAYEDLRALVLPFRAQVALFAAFTLAFAIKMPLFPLHTWSPETYRDAPTSVAMMASAVVAKLGAYGILRWSVGLFPYGSQFLGPTCALLAIVGILYAAFAAWGQRDLKTLLAYASMSHMGYVALGIWSMTPQGQTGAVVQMLSHGITSAGLFLLAGTIESRTGTREIGVVSGFAKDRPHLALLFVLVALSGAGVPATSGFVGEFLVLSGTFASNEAFGFGQFGRTFAASAALAMIFGAIYILRVLRKVLFGPARPEDEGKPDLTVRELVCLSPLAVLIIALGVFPGYVIDRVSPALSAELRTVQPRFETAKRATVPYISNPELARTPPPRAEAAPDEAEGPTDAEAPTRPRPEVRIGEGGAHGPNDGHGHPAAPQAAPAPADPAPIVPVPAPEPAPAGEGGTP